MTDISPLDRRTQRATVLGLLSGHWGILLFGLFAVGAETGWHRHAYDYVVVCLTPGKLLAETKDGNVETPLHAGQAYARPLGVEHNIVNTSEDEFAFVEVELK